MFGCWIAPSLVWGKFSRQRLASGPLLYKEDTPRAFRSVTHSMSDEGKVARLSKLDFNEPALGRLQSKGL